MTAVEMVNKFYDVLENTNTAFSITRMRPVVDVVLQYLNEAQTLFFNERYLPGDTLTNISNLKLLRQELLDLVEEDEVVVEKHNDKDYHFILVAPLNGIFIEGFISVHHELLDLTVRDSKKYTPTELVPVTIDSIGKFLTNHTNYPILLQPVIALGNAGEVIGRDYSPNIITDSMTTLEEESDIIKAYITTVQLPARIDIRNESSEVVQEDCRLHPRFHEVVVRTAVEVFLREKNAFADQERDKE